MYISRILVLRVLDGIPQLLLALLQVNALLVFINLELTVNLSLKDVFLPLLGQMENVLVVARALMELINQAIIVSPLNNVKMGKFGIRISSNVFVQKILDGMECNV